MSISDWIKCNIAFVAWHEHWKGVYLHCVHPRYCIRLFLWGVDWHLKQTWPMPSGYRPIVDQAKPPKAPPKKR